MNELKFKGDEGIKAVAWFAAYTDTLSPEKTYTVTVKEQKKRRSLDSNAYAWVLMDKLAEKLNMDKIEIYKQYIKEIGGVSETVCVLQKAADKLISAWESKGLGWQAEIVPSKLNKCVNVILYYGSSVYDTAQMARLIDMIVADCQEYDIPTYSKEEIDSLLQAWGINER